MRNPRNRLAHIPSDTDSDRLIIGVHVLTEFEYCPRAGLIAYESEG